MFIKKLKNLITYDNVISKEQGKQQLKNISITGFLVSFSFFVLSLLNIFQNSYKMFILTSISCVAIFIATLIGLRFKIRQVISHIIILCCTIIFSAFTILGGNEGFAVLWLVLVPSVSILLFDMKLGFLCSTYFLIFLFVLFWTPLSGLIYNYGTTFLIRFPFLYLISYGFSIYVCVATKRQQYLLIMHERSLEYKKQFDKMTGVYNRSKYEEMLNNDFKFYNSVGVLFFDINGLKFINDNYGHINGDFIIKRAVKSIEVTMSDEMMLFRIGGDEFVLIIPNCTKKYCEEFLLNWKQTLQQMNALQCKYICSAAVGMAFANSPYDIKEVIKEADEKMYLQKQNDIKQSDIKQNKNFKR